MAVNGLSQAALAKAIGLSPAMIVKLKRQGMPVHSVEAAKTWREKSQRPYMKPDGPATPPPASGGALGAGEDGEAPDFRVSRARREAAEADIAEHKAAELRGELIRRDVVTIAEEKKAVSIKESLLQMPPQLAPVLAAEGDMARCFDILMDAVMAVLVKISARAG